ncbi:hypothetical protein HMPREF9996_01602 [Aggregatibacter actinomycetemcomitans Y4]|nr:hypothetical protein CF65_02773 [Aggregatibacter actinomycetemcomitans HK1651]EKX95298.1 hypothetical protein HMPREF9996_01602 [Aggregatibacter actinomycetemcomitans Y4]
MPKANRKDGYFRRILVFVKEKCGGFFRCFLTQNARLVCGRGNFGKG